MPGNTCWNIAQDVLWLGLSSNTLLDSSRLINVLSDHVVRLVLEGPLQRWIDVLHRCLHPKAPELLQVSSGRRQGTVNLLQGILGLFIARL